MEGLKKEMGDEFGPCFISGVPGTFYGRLFPTNALNFVHSSYSLMWLSQDLIEDAKLNTFNLPHYTPSLAEVKCLVEKEGSFSIISSNGRYIDWNACGGEVHKSRSVEETGKSVTKCMSVVSKSLLVSHFGVRVIEETFHKYQKNIIDSMSKGNRRFFNVTVSLVRKPKG
ncbi:unnamed protein product [Cuscuta europaea]|uniref:Uncharacterized protein n=1 Tax=Cuscuta europaea TaxID=41803 RepID=A0A9P1E1E0_CUSEU|nr:unnamed protein product [Cuscuta europaea]